MCREAERPMRRSEAGNWSQAAAAREVMVSDPKAFILFLPFPELGENRGQQPHGERSGVLHGFRRVSHHQILS
jgi:hypothetical protein